MYKCFTADIGKFIAGLLYIAQKLSDMGAETDFYRIFKIMFFSDIKSLPNYYQTVFGDWHALPYGPAPENLYQIIKRAQAGERFSYFELTGNNITPLTAADLDEFSESDIECIDDSIRENAFKSFDQLKDESHRTAWEKTLRGYSMSIIDIAADAGASESAINEIRDRAINCSPNLIVDSFDD